MNLKSITFLLTGCVFTAACITSLVSQAKANDVRLICASGFDQQTNQRFPTTFAWTPRGKIAVIRWKYSWFNNRTLAKVFCDLMLGWIFLSIITELKNEQLKPNNDLPQSLNDL